jgi:hypothetical protein
MRHLLWALTFLVGSVLLSATPVAAQTAPKFTDFIIEHPCGLHGGLKGPASTLTDSNGHVVMVFTCVNDTVIMRVFSEPPSTLTFPLPGLPPSSVPPKQPYPQCDTLDRNWNGTGMTECQWIARYPRG